MHYVAVPTPEICDACPGGTCVDLVSTAPGRHEFAVSAGTTCESQSGCDCPAGEEACISSWGFSGPMVELRQTVEYPAEAAMGVDLIFPPE